MQREIGEEIVRDVIDEDEEQREAAKKVEPKVSGDRLSGAGHEAFGGR
jgi:hypothetical protein